MSSDPRIYSSLQECTPLFNNYNIMRPSQNIPLPPRIYPFQQIYMCDPTRIYPSLPEYTPFSTTVCDPFRKYPSLPEYTPFSKTICDPPRIYLSLPEYTPFPTTIILCDPPRIDPSLPEYTPLFNNYNIMRPSQKKKIKIRIGT